MIQAIKNEGQPNQMTKQFSEEAWKLMGRNKNGWDKVSDSLAENTVVKKPQPETGNKAVATSQVVENTVIEKPAVIVEDDKKKKLFFQLIQDNLTKNVIKNYLDDDAVNVAYKTNTLEGLSEVLYTHFNGNIAELKTSKLFVK